MATFTIIKEGKEITSKEALGLYKGPSFYDPLGYHNEKSDCYVRAICEELQMRGKIDRFEVHGEMTKIDSKPGVIY